ncbi:MAG: hypothetical protein ACR2HH_00315 [Chthoniobacterales bacterium]
MPSKLHSLGHNGCLLLALAFCLTSASPLPAASPTPLPAPKSAGSLFKERPFGPLPPPTEAPVKRFDLEEEKPIPREWIIGGVAVGLLILALILWGSARAWRSSNLFDQQYRFPENPAPALRLGGTRSGGHLATIGQKAKRSPNETR